MQESEGIEPATPLGPVTSTQMSLLSDIIRSKLCLSLGVLTQVFGPSQQAPVAQMPVSTRPADPVPVCPSPSPLAPSRILTQLASLSGNSDVQPLRQLVPKRKGGKMNHESLVGAKPLARVDERPKGWRCVGQGPYHALSRVGSRQTMRPASSISFKVTSLGACAESGRLSAFQSRADRLGVCEALRQSMGSVAGSRGLLRGVESLAGYTRRADEVVFRKGLLMPDIQSMDGWLHPVAGAPVTRRGIGWVPAKPLAHVVEFPGGWRRQGQDPCHALSLVGSGQSLRPACIISFSVTSLGTESGRLSACQSRADRLGVCEALRQSMGSVAGSRGLLRGVESLAGYTRRADEVVFRKGLLMPDIQSMDGWLHPVAGAPVTRRGIGWVPAKPLAHVVEFPGGWRRHGQDPCVARAATCKQGFVSSVRAARPGGVLRCVEKTRHDLRPGARAGSLMRSQPVAGTNQGTCGPSESHAVSCGLSSLMQSQQISRSLMRSQPVCTALAPQVSRISLRPRQGDAQTSSACTARAGSQESQFENVVFKRSCRDKYESSLRLSAPSVIGRGQVTVEGVQNLGSAPSPMLASLPMRAAARRSLSPDFEPSSGKVFSTMAQNHACARAMFAEVSQHLPTSADITCSHLSPLLEAPPSPRGLRRGVSRLDVSPVPFEAPIRAQHHDRPRGALCAVAPLITVACGARKPAPGRKRLLRSLACRENQSTLASRLPLSRACQSRVLLTSKRSRALIRAPTPDAGITGVRLSARPSGTVAVAPRAAELPQLVASWLAPVPLTAGNLRPESRATATCNIVTATPSRTVSVVDGFETRCAGGRADRGANKQLEKCPWSFGRAWAPRVPSRVRPQGELWCFSWKSRVAPALAGKSEVLGLASCVMGSWNQTRVVVKIGKGLMASTEGACGESENVVPDSYRHAPSENTMLQPAIVQSWAVDRAFRCHALARPEVGASSCRYLSARAADLLSGRPGVCATALGDACRALSQQGRSVSHLAGARSSGEATLAEEAQCSHSTPARHTVVAPSLRSVVVTRAARRDSASFASCVPMRSFQSDPRAQACVSAQLRTPLCREQRVGGAATKLTALTVLAPVPAPASLSIGKGSTISCASTSAGKGHASFVSMTSLLSDEHRTCSCSVRRASGATLRATSTRLRSLRRLGRDPLAAQTPAATPCLGDRIGLAHVPLRRKGPGPVTASTSPSPVRRSAAEVTVRRNVQGELALVRFASVTPSLRRGHATQVTSSRAGLRSEARAPAKCHHRRAVFAAVPRRDVMALAVLRAPRPTRTQSWSSAPRARVMISSSEVLAPQRLRVRDLLMSDRSCSRSIVESLRSSASSSPAPLAYPLRPLGVTSAADRLATSQREGTTLAGLAAPSAEHARESSAGASLGSRGLVGEAAATLRVSGIRRPCASTWFVRLSTSRGRQGASRLLPRSGRVPQADPAPARVSNREARPSSCRTNLAHVQRRVGATPRQPATVQSARCGAFRKRGDQLLQSVSDCRLGLSRDSALGTRALSPLTSRGAELVKERSLLPRLVDDGLLSAGVKASSSVSCNVNTVARHRRVSVVDDFETRCAGAARQQVQATTVHSAFRGLVWGAGNLSCVIGCTDMTSLALGIGSRVRSLSSHARGSPLRRAMVESFLAARRMPSSWVCGRDSMRLCLANAESAGMTSSKPSLPLTLGSTIVASRGAPCEGSIFVIVGPALRLITAISARPPTQNTVALEATQPARADPLASSQGRGVALRAHAPEGSSDVLSVTTSPPAEHREPVPRSHLVPIGSASGCREKAAPSGVPCVPPRLAVPLLPRSRQGFASAASVRCPAGDRASGESMSSCGRRRRQVRSAMSSSSNVISMPGAVRKEVQCQLALRSLDSPMRELLKDSISSAGRPFSKSCLPRGPDSTATMVARMRVGITPTTRIAACRAHGGPRAAPLRAQSGSLQPSLRLVENFRRASCPDSARCITRLRPVAAALSHTVVRRDLHSRVALHESYTRQQLGRRLMNGRSAAWLLQSEGADDVGHGISRQLVPVHEILLLASHAKPIDRECVPGSDAIDEMSHKISSGQVVPDSDVLSLALSARRRHLPPAEPRSARADDVGHGMSSRQLVPVHEILSLASHAKPIDLECVPGSDAIDEMSHKISSGQVVPDSDVLLLALSARRRRLPPAEPMSASDDTSDSYGTGSKRSSDQSTPDSSRASSARQKLSLSLYIYIYREREIDR